MFLSKELLEKYRAPITQIEQFAQRYPNGIEVLDFLDENKQNSSKRDFVDMCFWGHIHLPYEDCELEKMKEILQIDTSTRVWSSHNIFESDSVSLSMGVTKSAHIENSREIENSLYVNLSRRVENSQFVWQSGQVRKSSFISESWEIEKCADVYGSDYCFSSNHILLSNKCRKSEGLIECNNVEHSAYSSKLENCSYCLFCTELGDKKFHIFNQEVSSKDFFIWDALIRTYMRDNSSRLEKDILSVKAEKNTYCGFELENSSNSYSLFQNWDKAFFNELRKFPKFNKWFLYKLTMNKNVLELDN